MRKLACATVMGIRKKRCTRSSTHEKLNSPNISPLVVTWLPPVEFTLSPPHEPLNRQKWGGMLRRHSIDDESTCRNGRIGTAGSGGTQSGNEEGSRMSRECLRLVFGRHAR